LCPDKIPGFCVQTWFTCSTVQTTRWSWLPQYILNTSAEVDGLVRSTKRNRRHQKAGEVGTINIQERQIAKLIQCQRMAWPQQSSAASTVQTRLGFRCSSVQTQFTCFVSRHDSRVLCPDTIHVFCVQTRFTCFLSAEPVSAHGLTTTMLTCLTCPDKAEIQLFQFPDTIHVFRVQTRFTCVVSRHDSRV
jgi:hypothetical protein